ncbi:AFG1-like ATPase-domain-containing protein [Myxozyma melibiosi]|uniref:AFG1-like ATPase-domain-containing protein n=1 Tax=Myxozyma melibiosi TaxID=54550 RepID=A0ABR1FBI2_9ASCO
MLMDLFAASLPHGSKRRWHYHSFMLSVYSRIHRETQRHQRLRFLPDSSVKKQRINLQNEYVLLKIAQELVEESAVLLLDEFMLPDIAAAKIVRTLFTYFFKMGGVLVATSNRLPKELYSADFKKSQFGSFYDILQARCISYDMRSQRDWRRILCEESAVEEADKRRIQRYWVAGRDPEAAWEEMLREMTSSAADNRAETANEDVEEIKVYGRTVRIPWARDGVAKFTFEELCDSPLAGADYISIASRYHTVILDGVPALRLNKKNQARRMITLLDALYECRVRLVVRAETEADELFFPEMKRHGVSAAEVEVGKNSRGATQQQEEEEEDSLELEMYSEVDLDLSSPYRPNVSAYDETEKEKTFATAAAPGVADGRETGEGQTSDYTRASAFTGEDERFAFKRAISRLKEMTGSDAWWEQERWMPVDEAVRTWEGSLSLQNKKSKGGVIEDGSERAGLHGRWEGTETNAFQRYNEEPAPRFSVAHFWSMVSWGPGKRRDERTRRWMRGAEGFGGEGEREREKERKREEE